MFGNRRFTSHDATRLRQFRQPSFGDWNSVIGAMREALCYLAAGDRDQLRIGQLSQ